MLIPLKQLTSFKNLSRSNPQGQIATVLILIMVVILIFVITTVNLGKLSLTTTTVSNAADATVLSLASRLASATHKEWRGLGNQMKWCKKGGLLGVVLAIGAVIAAAILTIVIPGSGAVTIPAIFKAMIAHVAIMMAAGAAGGALGGAIVYGSAKGAAIGAVLGAGIGLAMAGGAAFGQMAAMHMGAGWTLTASSAAAHGITLASSQAIITSVLGLAIGTALGTAAGAAGQIYVEAKLQQAYSPSDIDRIMGKIDRIPDNYIRIREQTLFEALLKVVDDPTKVRDERDVNSNGDTNEMTPRFLYKYETEHFETIRNVNSAIDHIGKFQYGDPLTGQKGLVDYVNSDSGMREFLRFINRQEVECSDCTCYPTQENHCCKKCTKLEGSGEGTGESACDNKEVECGEGSITQLVRALKKCEHDISWEPGPNKDVLLKFYQCDTCANPSGYDDLDFIHQEYEEFIDAAQAIIDKKTIDLDYDHEWVKLFYKPDTLPPPPSGGAGRLPPEDQQDQQEELYAPGDADYYHMLGKIRNGDGDIKGLNDWLLTLDGIRLSLPKCQVTYGEYTPEVTTLEKEAPCGKEYSPKYLYYAGLTKEEAEELSEDEKQEKADVLAKNSPFYPCAWKKYIIEEEGKEQNAPKEGPHFPNSPCKLTTLELADLEKQIETIGDEVDKLPEELIKDHRPIIEAECLAGCEGNSGCTCKLTSLAVHIVKISLTNPGIKGRCSRETNGFPSRLSYSFYFTYTCERCCIVIDEEGNEEIVCTISDGRYPPGEELLPGFKDLGGVTEIVYIPEQEGEGAVEAFLKLVAEIASFVGRLGPCGCVAPIPVLCPFATIDADSEDEFCGGPLRAIKEQVDAIPELRNMLRDFYNELQDASRERPQDGAGTLSYEWEDSLGRHMVTAQTGPFKLAKVERKEEGVSGLKWLKKKICLEILNGCENTGSDCDHNGPPYRTWVRITREDPANTRVSQKKNVLGKWNPFDTGGGKVSITRESVAYYNYNKVGIKARKR